ncbi:GGDEF domain-containing protein [Bacillus alkalicellulosilyticus]|uniref:GGDEF domain-containing protein n=1 Tax=Alkalihalobacterium alkalicellulosilyticum TaxID=1912214 RepID=UPI00099748CA|nr:GGDEF domain-containing protein [Bacillus alkalicellulosilyticus]
MRNLLIGKMKTFNLIFLLFVAITYLFLLIGTEEIRQYSSALFGLVSFIIMIGLMSYTIYKMPRGKDKLGWTFLLISVIFFNISGFLWSLKGTDYTPATFSLWDALYLIPPVLFLFAVTTFLSKSYIKLSIQNGIDLAISITVMLVLQWTFLISPVLQLTGLPVMNKFFAIFYPLVSLSLSLGFIFFVVALRKTNRIRIHLIYLALASIVWALANHLLVFQTMTLSYKNGSFLEPLWGISMLLLAMSCYMSFHYNVSFEIEKQNKNIIISQTFFSYFLVLVLLLGFLFSNERMTVLVLGLFITISLMIVHQFISMLNKENLVISLKEANKKLMEQKVKAEAAMIQLKLVHEAVDLQAKTDFLTSLYNRRYITQVLESLVQLNQPFSIIILDIDHFKDINDKYGHDSGDEVLVKVAKILSEHVRSEDTVGRFGGEEFIIVLPETNRKDAKNTAEQICLALAAQKISTTRFQSIKLTASFGVTERKKKESLNSVIVRADRCLYQAKSNGRNCVSVG